MKKESKETIFGIIGFILLLCAIGNFVFSLSDPHTPLWKAFIAFGVFFIYVIIISFLLDDTETTKTPIQNMNPSKRRTDK